MDTKEKNRDYPEESYKGICMHIHYYSAGFTIVLGILSVFLFAAIIGQIIDGRPPAADIVKSAFYAYYSILFFLVANYMRRIFSRLRAVETPFMYDIADKMKGLGSLLCGGGIVGALLFTIIKLFIDDLDKEWAITSGLIGFALMLVGMIFTVFALIFERGCKLQQESDETL